MKLTTPIRLIVACAAIELIALAAMEDHAPNPCRNLDKFAMSACKAAVKANDRLTEKEALALLALLAECEQPFACPHGRPTVLNITKKELERRFGRR